MKQPLWKKLVSYVYEFSVECIEGKFNPYLEVLYSKGRYQLATENAIYSHEDLYTNYFEAFVKIQLNQQSIDNVLILGLGLGSIPVMLENNFGKSYHYTAVELDEEVIYLANKYGLNQLASPIEYVCADARLFVMQCEQAFDLICVDLFMDDLIPDQFLEADFLLGIRELLAPGGLVMYNCLAANDMDTKATSSFFNQTFKTVFPKGIYLDVHKNWMLLNRPIN